jgi:type I restriction enzyme M protein
VVSVNVDVKNPDAAEALEHIPPEQLVERILEKERRILEIMARIQAVLEGATQ